MERRYGGSGRAAACRAVGRERRCSPRGREGRRRGGHGVVEGRRPTTTREAEASRDGAEMATAVLGRGREVAARVWRD